MTFRELRRAKEISQAALAEKVNVSTGTIINWEKDPGMIPIRKAAEISAALGVTMDDIDFIDKEDLE